MDELISEFDRGLRSLTGISRMSRPVPAPADAPAPVASGFTLDTDGARVSWLGHALDLTRYEFGLLALLVRHPGRIYSREQLM
ncbi:winged helix-turn-helix domain-containing protein, partial [Bacillus subtilis]|nr:winged helix-turn-helix domain-containing protein [Bacillus subtilis]